MVTTIHVSEATLRRLKEKKAQSGARSYDELLHWLLTSGPEETGSRFGTHPRMKPFEHATTGRDD